MTFGGSQAGANVSQLFGDASSTSCGSTIQTITSSYSANDDLTAISDSNATINYTLDALGRATSISNSIAGLTPSVTLNQSFNAAGLRTELKATIGSTLDLKNSYQYDTLGRLTELIQQGQSGGNAVSAKRATIAYNALNQRTLVSRYQSTGLTNAVATTEYSYDTLNRLSGLTRKQGTTTLIVEIKMQLSHGVIVGFVFLWGLIEPAIGCQLVVDKTIEIEKLQRFCEECNWKEAQNTLLSLNANDVEDYWSMLARLRLLNGEIDEAVKIVEANQIEELDAWGHAALGYAYADRSTKKCKHHLSSSLTIDPTISVAQYAVAFASHCKDPEFASQSLLKLFKRHPTYMAGYSTDLGIPVEEAELAHGKEQVEMICRDRPELGKIIKESQRLQQWLALRFSGHFIGRPAKWNSSYEDRNSDFDGYHRPSGDNTVEIFVNPNINVEDQLATVVFELLNAETLTESTILFDKATSAEIEKQMFVTEIVRLEHRALLKRKAFFAIEHALGGLPKNSSISSWDLGESNDFEGFYRSVEDSLVRRYEASFDGLSKSNSNVKLTKP